MPQSRHSNAEARFLLRKNKASLIISKMRYFTWNATETAEIMARTLSSKQIQSLQTMVEKVQDEVLRKEEAGRTIHDI